MLYESIALPLSYTGLAIADIPDYTVCPLLCQAFFQPEPYDLVIGKQATKKHPRVHKECSVLLTSSTECSVLLAGIAAKTSFTPRPTTLKRVPVANRPETASPGPFPGIAG